MSQKTEVVITARDETRAAFSSVQRGLQGLSATAAGMKNTFSAIGGVGGIAGSLGIAALASTVKSAIDGLDALNDSVERLGVSAEDLSALNFAGKLNGVQADEMADALKRLSVKMKDAADGGKEAGALFEALGIKVTDSSGRLKSADAVFAEVAESFAGMEDGAGKTAIAVETFGKSGAKLVPVLNAGADGLKKMREEGEALGAIIDGKLVKQAAEFNDNLDRLKTVSAAAGISIASDLLPSLIQLSEEFLIGIKNSGGFFNALLSLGTINPFKNTSENLATVRADMAAMEADQKQYGYLDEARYNRKKTQLAYLKDIQIKEVLAGSDGNYGNEGRGKSASTVKRAAPSLGGTEDKPGRRGGGGSAKSQIDDAERMLATMRERITLNEQDLQSVDKMTAVEKESAKVKFQLETGTLKATEAQKQSILANFEQLAAQEKALKAQEEYRRGVEQLEQTNAKQRQEMVEQTEALKRSAETYGLAESTISSMVSARLEDAIAIARQNGASEEAIAVLDEELDRRKKLTAALEDNDLARLVSNTASAKAKKTDADLATLDRALASGKIDKNQYEEAIAGIKDSVSELDEFTKQAARNMQTAFADFLFDPFSDGVQSMAQKFGTAIQRMVADAASAQLMNILFGEMGKTGKISGLVGTGIDWLTKSFSGGSSLGGGGIYSWADGGIMTSDGPVPLRKYARGGIATSPQMAMFGEGSMPEAYVPLPDGRRIPVQMAGGGQPVNQVMNFYGPAEPAQVKRAAAAGARQVVGLSNGARRYS